MARKRNYFAAPSSSRCKKDIGLRDGSGAQCSRRRADGSSYCKQHTNMLADAALARAIAAEESR